MSGTSDPRLSAVNRVRAIVAAMAAEREPSLKARARVCTLRMAIAATLPVHPSFESAAHG